MPDSWESWCHDFVEVLDRHECMLHAHHSFHLVCWRTARAFTLCDAWQGVPSHLRLDSACSLTASTSTSSATCGRSVSGRWRSGRRAGCWAATRCAARESQCRCCSALHMSAASSRGCGQARASRGGRKQRGCASRVPPPSTTRPRTTEWRPVGPRTCCWERARRAPAAAPLHVQAGAREDAAADGARGPAEVALERRDRAVQPWRHRRGPAMPAGVRGGQHLLSSARPDELPLLIQTVSRGGGMPASMVAHGRFARLQHSST